MEENTASIKVYTLLFFVVILGFIGFLVYQGFKDADYKDKISPGEKSRKSRSVSVLTVSKN